MAEFIRKDTPVSPPPNKGVASCFSPNGAICAVTHYGAPYFSLYNASSWDLLPPPATSPDALCRAVAFSPDGGVLALGSGLGVRLYETTGWTALPGLNPGGTCAGISFHGSLMAVAHSIAPYVSVYDTTTWARLPSPAVLPPNVANDVAFSHDGSRLAVAHIGGAKVTVYNTSDWSKLPNSASQPAYDGKAVCFSPDGAELALGVAGAPHLFIYSVPGMVKRADPAQPPTGAVNGVCYSPDGTSLFAVSLTSPYLYGYATDTLSRVADPVLPPNGSAADVAVNPVTGDIVLALTVAPYIAIYETGTGMVLAGDRASTAWPLLVSPSFRASTGWTIDAAPPPSQRASTGWRVTVATPQRASSAWPVAVLEASAVGGLDGAGAWAAAPDGRWMARVLLGGEDISARLTGVVRVAFAADAARTAEFAFMPSSAIQPLALIGRKVRIAFARADGSAAQWIFAGVLDVPRIDTQTGVISCSCHDQAQEIWAKTARTQIDALVGGRWHVSVSGEPDDNFAYMQDRMQSVGASWALDINQSPRIIPWRGLPRLVTVRSADVIDGALDVDLPSREQLRTRVVCRLQYRYTRLRARGAVAQYAQPIGFFIYSDVFSVYTRGFLLRSMVLSALERVPGWDLQGAVRTEHIAPGVYQAAGALNPVMGAVIISETAAPEYLLSARANYSTRWQQTITEDWTVTVANAALEAQIGTEVGEQTGCTIEAAFDVQGWASDPTLQPVVQAPAVGDAALDWQPAGYAPSDRDEALRTLLDRAWVRLWSSSRTGRVRFSVPCRPDLWLDTWVAVETDRVRASGAIVEGEHTLDIEAGSAVTSVSVAVALPGNTDASHPTWTLPAAPSDAYTPPPSAYSFEIGTFVGGRLLSPPWDEESMIGFATNENGGGAAGTPEYYPHQFSVRAPALAEEDRDPRSLTAQAEIAVEIPTDVLEILSP